MRKTSRWRHYRNYIFLVPLFLVAIFYQVTYSVIAISVAAHSATTPSRPFATDGRLVTGVDAQTAQAGLHPGDRILSVNGKDFTGTRVLFEEIRNVSPDERLTITAAAPGQSARTIQVPPRFRDSSAPAFWGWVTIGAILGVMLLCVLAGVYVAAVLPFDIRAISVFGLMVATAQLISIVSWYQFPRWLWVFTDAFHVIGIASWSAWLVVFVLYFPHRFGWDMRSPWIKWTFLGPLILWSGIEAYGSIAAYYSFDASAASAWIGKTLFLSSGTIMSLAISFFFAAAWLKIKLSRNADSCRRLRVLYAGSLVSLVPVGGLVLYQFLTQKNEFSHIPQAIFVPVCLLFCLFPLTLGYVVLAERAMNVRMVVRHGVRYALARGGLRVVLSLIAAGLIVFVNSLILGSMLGMNTKIIIFVAAIIGISFLIRKTRARFQTWIDRKFFRETYNAERVLEELSDSVLSIVDERALLDTVTRQISRTLHVPQMAVFLGGEGAFRPAYCLGFEPKAELALAEESKTVAVVKAQREARVYFDRHDNWVHDAPETELVTLKSIHAQLLLPVGCKGRLLGIFSLGPKLSEEPYSSTDVHLLRSVAAQTGLALENSRLTTAVATEMAQRERLNREIEIAREVQERLFPQQLPAIAGIDYSGACRPALGVGGDYYDFLPLANGDLGIAVGDVSGKGIAAALLMASLQASLRGQAMVNQGDLACLMTNVNRLVFDATPINRYATFFYGQYSRESRLFRYVNAGHNPPIVLRRTEDGTVHVIRLEAGGPVVGLFPSAPYQEGSLRMEPGDILVGFTDGISEAMNNEDEEWGEERLIPALAAHADRSAAEIIPAVIQDADRFVSGAPQHDDMTLVVVKMAAAAGV